MHEASRMCRALALAALCRLRKGFEVCQEMMRLIIDDDDDCCCVEDCRKREREREMGGG
jgi:hypothetical protein